MNGDDGNEAILDFLMCAASIVQAETVTLDGKSLTIDQAMEIARGGSDVEIDPAAASAEKG